MASGRSSSRGEAAAGEVPVRRSSNRETRAATASDSQLHRVRAGSGQLRRTQDQLRSTAESFGLSAGSGELGHRISSGSGFGPEGSSTGGPMRERSATAGAGEAARPGGSSRLAPGASSEGGRQQQEKQCKKRGSGQVELGISAGVV